MGELAVSLGSVLGGTRKRTSQVSDADAVALAYLRSVHEELTSTEERPANPEEAPECPGGCSGAGWLSRPGTGGNSVVPCPICKEPEIRQKRINAIFGAADVPEEYRGLSFDTYRLIDGADRPACDRVEEWARNGPGSIYLYGKVGRGKTGLAICAMVHRIEWEHVDALYQPMPRLLRRIRDTYSRSHDGPGEEEVASSVERAGLLLLDDIGTNNPTKHVEEVLYSIVNERKAHQRPTIFTSNLTLAQVGEQLGGRVAWRIKEMCEGHIVQVDGVNLRDRARA